MNIKQTTIILTLGILSSLTSPLMAQTAKDLGTFPSNERSPNSGGLGGDINPMKLLHQLQLNNGRSMEDFMLDSNRNIDSAASDFRKQQQEIMLQSTSSNTEPNPLKNQSPNQ